MRFLSMSARKELVGTVILGLFRIGAFSKGVEFNSEEEMAEYAVAQYKTNPTFHESCNFMMSRLLGVMEREVARIRSGRN